MDHKDVLVELYGRIDGHVADVLAGLEGDDLTWRPSPDANSIGWLVWHLSRVLDHHISDLAGVEQTWVSGSWAKGFGLEPDPDNTGYGHSAADVASVQPSTTSVLGGYYTRVSEHTAAFLAELGAEDLDRVVDTRWDPPVTMGVRLVSAADDAIQHLGAAAYLKGLLPR